MPESITVTKHGRSGALRIVDGLRRGQSPHGRKRPHRKPIQLCDVWGTEYPIASLAKSQKKPEKRLFFHSRSGQYEEQIGVFQASLLKSL